MTADRAALLALAARVEAAAAPDPILDNDIMRELNQGGVLIPYTRDLTAALALVPEGWAVWRIEQTDLVPGEKVPRPLPVWTVTLRRGETYSVRRATVPVTCGTPALALTAAALRARAAEEG